MPLVEHRRVAGMCTTVIMLLAACLVLGCGRNTEPNPTPSPSSTPAGSASLSGDFKMALIMSGPTTDKGWNFTAYQAWLTLRKALSVSEANSPYVENVKNSSDQAENLRAFAGKGYNIIFGHGTEYEEPALKMESEFPNTLFVISSGSKVAKNTLPIVFRLEDGAYLEGMLAAGMSKTGIIGAVGADQSPQLASIFSAFARGAKSVNPSITVLSPVYTNNWDDAGKAKQAALALLDQNADVLIQDLDSAAQGVFEAVRERKQAGKSVYALGTNSDQNGAAPDVILASAPIYTDKAFLLIAQQAKAGTLKPNDTPFGLKESVIDFVLNPKLKAQMPAALKSRLDDTKKKIRDGSFTVPRGAM